MAKKSANHRLIRSDYNLLGLGLFSVALMLGVLQINNLTNLFNLGSNTPSQAQHVVPSDQPYAFDEPQESFAEELDYPEEATPDPLLDQAY